MRSNAKVRHIFLIEMERKCSPDASHLLSIVKSTDYRQCTFHAAIEFSDMLMSQAMDSGDQDAVVRVRAHLLNGEGYLYIPYGEPDVIVAARRLHIPWRMFQPGWRIGFTLPQLKAVAV